MEYNPFTERFVAKQREVETIEDEKRECSRQFVWYSNFNLDAEAGDFGFQQTTGRAYRIPD